MVLRRCRQLLRDENSAQDALQDVFLKLMEHRESLTAAYPSSLLYTMATRNCLDRLRNARPQGGLLEDIAASEDLEERLSARRLLERLFGRHQESSRVIAVLHLVDGLTLEETAEQVGLSMSGVRKRLAALQATLKRWSGAGGAANASGRAQAGARKG